MFAHFVCITYICSRCDMLVTFRSFSLFTKSNSSSARLTFPNTPRILWLWIAAQNAAPFEYLLNIESRFSIKCKWSKGIQHVSAEAYHRSLTKNLRVYDKDPIYIHGGLYLPSPVSYYCVTFVVINTRRPASAHSADRTARRQFQATGQPLSRTQANDAMTSRLPRYEAKCVQRRCFQWWSVPLCSDIKGTELPTANILIPLERQLIALQHCADSFYIMKLGSRLLVDFLLTVIELFFYLLPLRRYKAKRVKTHCLLERMGQFEPRFQRKGSSQGNIFWFLQN